MANVDIKTLTPAQRLDLLEEIWNSLTPEEVDLTESHKAELERRLGDSNEQRGSVSWDEAQNRIRGQNQ